MPSLKKIGDPIGSHYEHTLFITVFHHHPVKSSSYWVMGFGHLHSRVFAAHLLQSIESRFCIQILRSTLHIISFNSFHPNESYSRILGPIMNESSCISVNCIIYYYDFLNFSFVLLQVANVTLTMFFICANNNKLKDV